MKSNSTAILFLKMLKGDIKRSACRKVGVDPDAVQDDLGLLTGQKITISELESFSSYKLMNSDERAIVSSILDEMRHENSNSRDKTLVKQMVEPLVPASMEQQNGSIIPFPKESPVDFNYRDAA